MMATLASEISWGLLTVDPGVAKTLAIVALRKASLGPLGYIFTTISEWLERGKIDIIYSRKNINYEKVKT